MKNALILKRQFKRKDLGHPDVTKLCEPLCSLLLLTLILWDGPKTRIHSQKVVH